MAANAGTPIIGKRKHHRQRVMSEINVTPIVERDACAVDNFHGVGTAADSGRTDRFAAKSGQKSRPGQRAADRFCQRQGPDFPSRIAKLRPMI